MQKISEFFKNISYKKNKNSLFIILLIGVMLLLFNKTFLNDNNHEKDIKKQEYEYDIIKDKKNLDKYRELLDSYEDPLEKVSHLV